MFSSFRLLFAKYRELIMYVVFGILTSLVNFAVFYPLYNLTNIPAFACNSLAWMVAVGFAFLVNKRFVFCTRDWSAKIVLKEVLKFVGCRLGTGLLETSMLFFCADLLQMNGNLWKIIVSVIVIILNYVGSRFLVFTRK